MRQPSPPILRSSSPCAFCSLSLSLSVRVRTGVAGLKVLLREGWRSVKMNLCSYSQSASPVCDVVCPKPRRVGPCIPTTISDDYDFSPCRFQFHFPPEASTSRAGTEVLDLILAKGNSAAEESNSNTGPAFLWGSPPSRASNPLTQDARFKSDTTPRELPSVVVSPSASAASRGPIRMKVGHKPPPVRIEGFDCLGRDGQNRSISAVA